MTIDADNRLKVKDMHFYCQPWFLVKCLVLRLIKWDFMGRVAGILMLGYRYNSTKVPVSLVRHACRGRFWWWPCQFPDRGRQCTGLPSGHPSSCGCSLPRSLVALAWYQPLSTTNNTVTKGTKLLKRGIVIRKLSFAPRSRAALSLTIAAQFLRCRGRSL